MNKEWSIVKLGDVCTIERGGSPRPIDKFITEDNDGINWIKIGDTDESMYITKTAQKIKPEGMRKSRYVKVGDFLLSNSMSFGRPYILKIDGCIHDGWLVLRDEKCAFDKRFLYYLLSAPSTYRRFQSMAVGGVVNNLNSEMVRNLTVPLPSVEKQKDIADTLDEVEQVISISKQQLAKLDELVKSRFVEMFGEPDRNPMNWETAELERHLNVVGGFAFKSDGFTNSGIPVLRIGNINSGRFLPVNMVFWPDEPSLVRYKMYPGDLVMSLTGTVGKDDYGNVCILSDEYPEYYLNQRNAKLAIGATLNKHYLSEMLKFSGVKKRLTGISRGVRQANISNRDILALCVPIPPITLQEQFAAFVAEVDKSKLAVKQSLEKLETLKKSLMQQYFG